MLCRGGEEKKKCCVTNAHMLNQLIFQEYHFLPLEDRTYFKYKVLWECLLGLCAGQEEQEDTKPL